MKIVKKSDLKHILFSPLANLQRYSRFGERLVRKPYIKYQLHRPDSDWNLILHSKWSPQKVDEHLVLKKLWAPGLSREEEIILGSRPLDNSEIGRIAKILLFGRIKIQSEHFLDILEHTLRFFPNFNRLTLTRQRLETFEPILYWSLHQKNEGKKPTEPRRIGVGYKDKGSLSGPSPEGVTLIETRKEELELFEDLLLQRILTYPLP